MSKIPAYISLIIAAILWGGAAVAAKIGLMEFTPIWLSTLRFLIAIPVLIMITYVAKRESLCIRNPARDLPIFLLLGVSGVTLFYALQYNSLLYTTATIGSIVVNTNPIFIALLSAIVHKEKMGVKKVLGILISFSGLIIVITGGETPSSVASNSTIYGAFIMLLAAICWAVYTVAGKKILRDYSAIASTTITFIIGTLCFLPLLATNQLPEKISAVGWFSVFYLGIASGVLGYLLYNSALSKLEASKAGVFLYTIPIFAMVLSAIFLDEVVTWTIIAGAALVIYGIYLTERG